LPPFFFWRTGTQRQPTEKKTHGIERIPRRRNLGIRAERENVDDADISMLSIGIQYRFQ
jgi:hypothetical protein